jgi:uncharacterized delta-60 repeat protein
MLLAPFFRGFARHLLLACLIVTASPVGLLAQSNTPSAADGFDPNVDGNVFALATQGDGKVIVVGQFANLTPNGGISIARNNIARINPDGTLDDTFSPVVDGAVRAVVIQPNGNVVIGGDFTHIGSAARNHIARLDGKTGALDTSFSAGVDISTAVPTKAQVLALALQADGSVIAGGNFGTVSDSTHATGVLQRYLARFTSAGAIDTSYNPNPDGIVLALAPHINGSMVVGGGFTQFQPGSAAAISRSRIARITATGAVDAGFNPGADNGVTTLAVQRDGSIVVGGFFANLGGFSRSHLGRLGVDGSLDGNFAPVIGGNVLGLAVEPDGGILVGGSFSQVWAPGIDTTTRSFVARFNADGTLDQNFSPVINGEVDAFAIQSDDKVILGGYFTRTQPAGMTTQIVRNRLVRVSPAGAIDTAFQLDQGGRILTSALQSTGKIIIGGSFTSVGGVTHNHIARLNADGSVDNTFNSNVDGVVYTVAVRNDQVVLGGAFATVEGATRKHIARLNADGTLDTGFDPEIDGNVAKILIQSDGNILVGGSFTGAQPVGQASLITRANMLRLTSAGQVDNFQPSPNATVLAIAIQSDGKIVIGGNFSTLQPGGGGDVWFRQYLARLNADGSLDSNFNPNPNAQVMAVAVQSDGGIIVGGQFSIFSPVGVPATARSFLARIKSDGSVDANFNPTPNGIVLSLAVQSNNQILVGGAFTTMQPAGDTTWTLRKYFARLTTDGKVEPTLNLDLNELPGNRVDSITLLSGDAFLIGGTFVSLQPPSSAVRVARNHFARLTKDGALDTAFDPGAGGASAAQVNAISLQGDGKVVVAGNFSDLGGAKSSNLARFSAEGVADATFNTALSTNGTVNALAIRPIGNATQTQFSGFGWFDASGTVRATFHGNTRFQGRVNAATVKSDGSVYLGGAFADLSGQGLNNLVHFGASGDVDNTFAVTVNGAINAMVLQSDGKLVIVGAFSSVNGSTRNHIARVDGVTGALDNNFDPNTNGVISAVVLQSNAAIIIGGSFTSLTPNGTTTAVTRNNIARVNADGTLDTKYDPNLNGFVDTLALQTIGGNEEVVAGGNFTTVTPNAAASATTRNHIARFANDGSVDTGFDPNANNVVSAVAVQADGSIVLGGSFTTLQPTVSGTLANVATRYYLARVLSTGVVDDGFNPYPDAPVSFIAVSPNGSIVIGGSFNQLASGANGALARHHIARLLASGAPDQNFNPSVAGDVTGITIASDNSVLVGGTFSTLQPSGTILVGGSFSTIAGVALANLALLNTDGSVTGSFQPNPNGAVNTVLPLPNGSFVVGGAFNTISATARSGLARFSSTGAIDTTFAPAITGTVTTLALQPDGKVIVGANGVVRLNGDGSLDAGFNVAVSFVSPTAIVVQADGKIIVAGAGSGVGARVMRFNADGSVDSTFTAVVISGGADVQAVTLQTDGSIIIAGSFTNLGGKGINYLARLTPTGAVDTSFNPSPNATVTALALQSDGRLLLGGSFSSVGGLSRVGLARIGNTGSAVQTLGVSSDGKVVTWARTGTAGELAGVSFEWSSDTKAWAPIGFGSRITGSTSWQLTGQGLPTTSTFYIRARGIVPTSSGRSTGVYEEVRVFNLASPVAGTSTVLIPVSATAASVNTAQYAWAYDAETGTLKPIDLASGLAVDTTKPLSLDNSIGGKVVAAGARLADLATRGTVTADTPLISGFAIVGTAPRTVLIRAVGPGLAPFGVANYLRVPQLVLYDSTNAVIAKNNGWNAALITDFARTGAFPLTVGSTDSAFVVTLNPGTYTVQVADLSGAGSPGGEAMVEVYDAGDAADTSARLTNLSSRAVIVPGGTLIGGLVISGSTPRTMLIRGVGPSLTRFGVGSALADPKLAVYDADGHVVATNDSWMVSNMPIVPELDVAASVSNAGASVGAFTLDAAGKDAALIITLNPGTYTVQITSVDATGGTGMIEVYQLP